MSKPKEELEKQVLSLEDWVLKSQVLPTDLLNKAPEVFGAQSWPGKSTLRISDSFYICKILLFQNLSFHLKIEMENRINYKLKERREGWRDGTEVKSTYSCRRSRLDSQHPYGSSQPYKTPNLGDSISSGLQGTANLQCTAIHKQTTKTQNNKTQF